MESWCCTQEDALKELEKEAPGVPFLALGQTIFWDEPMKGMVVQAGRRLGLERPFIAGVHDTDYFAKHGKAGSRPGFAALPHNDTTTKDLWSAAAEFASLFGSETVVRKESLQAAGAKLARIEKERPGWLDQVTEAPGWRGIVSYARGQKTISEKPLDPLFPTLYDTFSWAIEESLSLISGEHHHKSLLMAQRLKGMVCDASQTPGQTLSQFYTSLLPAFYDLAAGEELGVKSAATTELLRFAPETSSLPRFHLLGVFLNSATRRLAEDAYNEAVKGTEMYTLDRFGVGALPFDVLVPGQGRGTLRLGTRGGVIMTPSPQGFSFKTPPQSPCELAEILQRRFGEGVVLIGKAVTLIGMLAAEHVFVFHEGASGYMPRTVKLHDGLKKRGISLTLHPILRVHHRPWDTMDQCCAWLKLPEALRRPFGTDELSAPSFAMRWREASAAQKALLQKLGGLRRPLDLVQFLQEEVGGHWRCLANEYQSIHDSFRALQDRLAVLRSQKKEVLLRIKGLRKRVDEAEKAKGVHWRERIFEKDPSQEDLAERERLLQACHRLREEVLIAWDQWHGLQADQTELVKSPEIIRAQERRAAIALEAELMRTRLVRDAILASQGLEHAGRRPSAWWLPLVCPDGTWQRASARKASFRVERLISS